MQDMQKSNGGNSIGVYVNYTHVYNKTVQITTFQTKLSALNKINVLAHEKRSHAAQGEQA